MTLAIASLLSGDEQYFNNWSDNLKYLLVPSNTNLYILDNSGSEYFLRMILKIIESVEYKEKFKHIHILSYGTPYRYLKNEPYLYKARHNHISQLYKKLFPTIKEAIILTFEEDIIPKPQSLNILLSSFNPHIGAVASCYCSPISIEFVCAGKGESFWEASIQWEEINESIVEVSFVGGGFTLWNNRYLTEYEISIDWDKYLGWDAMLSKYLREKGLKILLNPNAICGHDNRFLK